MLIRPPGTRLATPVLKKDPAPPPNGSTNSMSYEEWRALDGPLLGFFSSSTSSLVGAGNGLGTAVVGASAGGAHGIVHGAGLNPRWGNLLMGANLAAVGAATANYSTIQPLGAGLGAALGIALGGAGSSLRLGFSNWAQFPVAVQKEVFSAAEQWTDRLLAPKEGANGQERVARGAVGEIAGGAAGGLVGFRYGLQHGREVGRGWVDSIQRAIYENMHGRPTGL